MTALTEALRTHAPAKINLGLRVLRRRPDGFHDVETALLPIRRADQLRAAPAPALTLSCSDPDLPTDEQNIVIRAALALAARAGVAPGAAIELVKHVPHGAGLGGGSSDAAAALRLLSELWAIALPAGEMHALAARLGADVPFFLEAAAAMGTGRGDTLTPLRDQAGDAYRPPFDLAVIVPPVRVSTAEAYGYVTPDSRPRPDLAAAILSNDLERWRSEITNDFQEPVAARHGEVGRALMLLEAAGAGYASLSGSGSAVFGMFDGAGAVEAAGAAGALGWLAWAE